MMVKAKTSKKKQRIGHVYQGQRPVVATASEEGEIPRGWIHPNGKFFSTNHHWDTISDHVGEGTSSDPETGERNAHIAYARGWISIGHGGVINAIGHKSTFESTSHPAVVMLRKLVAKIPHFSLRVEKQIGKLDPESGRHEDFDVQEYDLDYFIKRGRLRKNG